jgi:hypothetical protein
MSIFGYWQGLFGLTDEQVEALEDPEYIPEAQQELSRTSFDLDNQSEDDFAAFLAGVEESENKRNDSELKREAEAEERVAKLRETIDD